MRYAKRRKKHVYRIRRESDGLYYLYGDQFDQYGNTWSPNEIVYQLRYYNREDYNCFKKDVRVSIPSTNKIFKDCKLIEYEVETVYHETGKVESMKDFVCRKYERYEVKLNPYERKKNKVKSCSCIDCLFEAKPMFVDIICGIKGPK